MSALTSVRIPVRIDFAGGWSDLPDFAAREGGAVLNAAIEPFVEGRSLWTEDGLDLRLSLDLPEDSHLGSSSSVNLALLRLTFGLIGETPDPATLAEKAFALEELFGGKGGKQDQYAAVLGGFNLLRFGGADEPAAVEPLYLSPERREALAERLVLCFSGPSEGSSDLHRQVWERYRDGDEGIAATLRSLRDSADPARDALLAGDWRALGAAMTLNRNCAARLNAGVVTDRLRTLFEASERVGALGGKPCGAGGGGCLIFLCEPDRRAAVERALRDAECRLLPVTFAPRTKD